MNAYQSLVLRCFVSACILLAGCKSGSKGQKQTADAQASPTWSKSIIYPFEPGGRLTGFYPGKDEWRFTKPVFTIRFDRPESTAKTILELDLTVPVELISKTGPNTLVAKVNGIEVGRKNYDHSVRDTFSCEVPVKALQASPVMVEFTVLKPAIDEGREIGVIVVSAGLKTFEASTEFQKSELEAAHAAYRDVIRKRDRLLPYEKQNELMRVFHDLPVWKSVRFHNVQTLKNPLDLWMLQQIAFEIQPEMVVETGTWRGGSALYWAHTLEGLGLNDARVLTVDIGESYNDHGAGSHRLWKKYVEFSKGSSTDKDIVARFAARVKGKRTIVNLDSDHRMEHVLNELRLYGPMVSPGSYMAVEDTHLDGVPTHPEQGPGPMAAIKRYLAEGGDKLFEQDFTREAFVMTSYPGGWLRRKSK